MFQKSIIKTIEKKWLHRNKRKNISRNPYKRQVERDKEYVLNDEQQYAYFRVNDYIKNAKFQEFLLYGVTGSGKTEVYFCNL